MDIAFRTVNVFSGAAFAGSQVAVVTDGEHLDALQMQAIAAEFGYAETAFLLPPSTRAATAAIRIFTRRREVPFAGQPMIAAASGLGRLGSLHGRPAGHRMTFETPAGVVPAQLLVEGAHLAGAGVGAPMPLEIGPVVAPGLVAACAGLAPEDIESGRHPPRLLSVGAPFVVAELCDEATLARATARRSAFRTHIPLGLARGLHLYARAGEDNAALAARTFTPLHGTEEGSASGSANAALAGFLATLQPSRRKVRFALSVAQGAAMGRPGQVQAWTEWRESGVPLAWVGGRCASVMSGHMRVPPPENNADFLHSTINKSRLSFLSA